MRQHLRTLSLILPLALLPLTFMTVFAQNAVPGDFLYGYKRGLEGVILASASIHPTTRAMFQSNLADRRFTEVEKVILTKQDTRGLDEFIFSVVEARENIEKVPDQQTRLQLRDELVSSIDEYQQKILEIKTIYVTQERVIEREKVIIVQQPTNTPVPIPTTKPGESPRPTNTPVPLPTAAAASPPLTQPPLPTNTPVPVPTTKPGGKPAPTNTPVPRPTVAPLPTATPTPTRTPTPIPPSSPVGGPSAQPPDIDIPQKCEHFPTIPERLQCAYDEAEKQKKAAARLQSIGPFQKLDSAPTPTPLLTIPPTPTPTPTPIPTCASYTNCQTCISSVLRCGWDGGNCRSGSTACPAGEMHWFYASCSIDECEASRVQLQPTPTPTPASCFLYGWNSETCSQAGQAPCTDCGGPSYCGWNESLWQACDQKCNRICSGGVQGVSIEEKNVFIQIVDWLTTPSIRTRIEGITP